MKVEKRGGRNRGSRLFHARNDKDKIAAWRAELDRILLVFNVRSVAFTWLSLIVPFSDRVELKYSCGSFRHSRRCVEDPGGDQWSASSGKSQFTPLTRNGCLQLSRPNLGQQPRCSKNGPAPYLHLNLACPENHLPRHWVPVSDVAT